MIDKHRIENEEWINTRKQELEEERRQVEVEKVLRLFIEISQGRIHDFF